MSFRDFVPRNSQGDDATGGEAEYRTPPQHVKRNTLRRAMSGGSNNHMMMMTSNNGGTPTTNHFNFSGHPQRFDTIEFCRSRSESDYAIQQSMMVQQREEEIYIKRYTR